jgi:hypothetical protein
MIRPIPAGHLSSYWPVVRALLQPAIDSGQRATADEVLQWLTRGDYQLWVCGDPVEIKAAATTAVTVYPGSKWLTIVHCGGEDMPSWLEDGIEALERWAIGCGCVGIEIIGRPEWGRVLPGFEPGGVVAQKLLMPVKQAAE